MSSVGMRSKVASFCQDRGVPVAQIVDNDTRNAKAVGLVA